MQLEDGYGGCNYFWTGKHDIFAFCNVTMPGFQAVHIDTDTNKEMPLPAVTAAFAPYVGLSLLDAQLSLDGKWILWSTYEKSHTVFYAARLDGSQFRRWQSHLTDSQSAFWMPDSRSWVEFRNTRTAMLPILHGLDGSEIHGKPIMFRTLSLVRFVSGSGRHIVSGCFNPLGVTVDRRIVSLELPDLGTPASEYPLEFGASVPKYYPPFPTLPSGNSRGVEMKISPRCDRIAFLANYSRPIPTGPFRLIFQRLHRDDGHIALLWTSRVDGSDVRVIGRLVDKQVDHVHWTQDEKRLSFSCDKGFYTVPVY